MGLDTELKKLTDSLLKGGMNIARKNLNDIYHNPSTRRHAIETGTKVVAGAGLVASTLYFASKIPFVYGQVEEEIPIGLATNPLGPEDLENGNWLKPEYWDNSFEAKFNYGFKIGVAGREAYLRMNWGKKGSTEWVAFLGDDVSETAEKPRGRLMVNFDTYNQRLEGKDPNNNLLPGDYGFDLNFDGQGKVFDKPISLNYPLPDGSIFYTSARAPSPISNATGARRNPHLLYCAIIKKEVLTSEYEEIGIQPFLWESKDTYWLMMFPSEADFGNMTFRSFPVPEIPYLKEAAAFSALLAANYAVARSKMSRRAFIGLPEKQ